MKTDGNKDFFISYNSADQSWAEWIAWHLEEAGYTVDIQMWDYLPGSNFILKMQQSTCRTSRTIAVLSPNYLDATFTHAEWAAAFAQDPKGEKRKLLPIRVEECELEGLFSLIVYEDFVGKTEAEALEKLLTLAGGKRRKPASVPAFPHSPTVASYAPKFPINASPTHWNIPHHRNPRFTGRDDELKQIRGQITRAGIATIIQGMGGIGKTQAAVEYAFRYQRYYQIIWWIRSEAPTLLLEDFAALALDLQLVGERMPDQSKSIKLIKEYLRIHDKWLLIFDNAQDEEILKDFLPQGPGHVLITSRNPRFERIGSTVPLEVWPRMISVTFILDRTEQIDSLAADTLAERLGDLPLTLEQAGAYIRETGTTITEYVNIFDKYQAELLTLGAPYDHPAATTT